VREKTVPTPEIDDAPAAADTPHAPRGLPGLEELLARQATRVTDGSGQTMEERVVGKATEIVIRQPVLRRWIELHARIQSSVATFFRGFGTVILTSVTFL
jgi:hypothetical protein